MKKILAFILVLTMVVSMLVVTAFAEDNVCTVSVNGGTAVGYTDFNEAMNSFSDGNTYVVEILSNVTLSTVSIGQSISSYNANTKITINGNDNTLSSEVTHVFYELGKFNLEVNDLTMVHTSSGNHTKSGWYAGSVEGGVATTFNNCTIVSTRTDDGLFKMKAGEAGYKFVLNLNNCTVSSAAESVFNVFNGTDATINITDTTIKHNSGIGPFNAKSLILCVNNNTKCTVNVKGASNLVVEPTFAYPPEELSPGSTANNVSNMFYARTGAPELTVNLLADDDGDLPTLFMNILDNGANDTRSDNRFVLQTDSAKITLNDNGATLKASAFAATKGVVLPEAVTDGTFLGWSSVDGLYKAGDYSNATATEDITFTSAVIDADSFKMLEGAAITTAEPYGMRFDVEIADELVNSLGSNAKFGMWIMPTEFLTGKTFTYGDLYTGEYLDIELSLLEDKSESDIYGTAITNISKSSTGVNMKFSARAYLRVTYADGKTNLLYADYSDTDNVRSLADVAKAYAASGVTDNTVINQIISLAG